MAIWICGRVAEAFASFLVPFDPGIYYCTFLVKIDVVEKFVGMDPYGLRNAEE